MSRFAPATKKRARLRLALVGPSGSGKTWSALDLATRLGKRIAVIDTERGSASKYADRFAFDVLELETFHPREYVNAIKEAEGAGYDIIVIDSLTHAWNGKGGALEMVDAATAKNRGNSYTAWRDVTPEYQGLIDAMLGSKSHIIATIRSKQDYVLVDGPSGKTPRKVGMAPVQRDGIEYEFDAVGELDVDNRLWFTKTRCPSLAELSTQRDVKPVADRLRVWLDDGTAPAAPRRSEPPAEESRPRFASNIGARVSATKTPEELKALWEEVTADATPDEKKAMGPTFAAHRDQLNREAAKRAAEMQHDAESDGTEAAE